MSGIASPASDARHQLGGDRRQQDPAAAVAGRPVQPVHRSRPDDRQVVGRPGPQAGRELVQDQLGHPGHELRRVAQQLEGGTGGDGGVKAPLLRGRAEHVAAVPARRDVGRAHADDALEQAGPRRIVQAHDLALDRAHRDPVGLGQPGELR